MDLELTPDQPETIADAIELLVGQPSPAEPDPWWRAGLEDALET